MRSTLVATPGGVNAWSRNASTRHREMIHVARVAAEDRGALCGRERRRRLVEVLHDAREFRVRVRVVACPDDALGTGERVIRGEGERRLVGVERDEALAPAVLRCLAFEARALPAGV